MCNNVTGETYLGKNVPLDLTDISDDGCTENKIRLARLLLTNTTLRINVNGTLSIEFQTSTGAFQGDAASGNLFTVVEAAALMDLQAIASSVSSSAYIVSNPIPNPPVALNYMPLETEYSDDINFNNTCLETLQQLFPIAKSVFEEYNLFINPSKTEYVHFYIWLSPNRRRRRMLLSELLIGAMDHGEHVLSMGFLSYITICGDLCPLIQSNQRVLLH